MQKRNDAVFVLKTALILLLVCGFAAGVLAEVNALTKDRIAENELRKRNDAVASMFGEGVQAAELETDVLSPVSGVLEIKKDGAAAGYAVMVTGKGFGDDIEMLVGVGTDGKIIGVRILSMAETPGVGSKTGEDAFLGQFTGRSGSLKLGGDINAVTGATISSRAVTDAVNAAVAAVTGE